MKDLFFCIIYHIMCDFCSMLNIFYLNTLVTYNVYWLCVFRKAKKIVTLWVVHLVSIFDGDCTVVWLTMTVWKKIHMGGDLNQNFYEFLVHNDFDYFQYKTITS